LGLIPYLHTIGVSLVTGGWPIAMGLTKIDGKDEVVLTWKPQKGREDNQ